MVVEAETKRHAVDVEEVHTMKVLVPMRNLYDSPNYGCDAPNPGGPLTTRQHAEY